jgi:hypothetical protein
MSQNILNSSISRFSRNEKKVLNTNARFMAPPAMRGKFFHNLGSKNAKNHAIVNSNLVQYLLQTDIQKRTEKIQWQIQTLHRDFSPGNPNRENQHILY